MLTMEAHAITLPTSENDMAKRHDLNMSSTEGLCERCRTIDFGDYSDTGEEMARYGEERTLCQLWKPSDVLTTTCPLCRLFLNERYGGEDVLCELRQQFSHRVFSQGPGALNLSFHEQCESTKLFVVPADYSTVSILPLTLSCHSRNSLDIGDLPQPLNAHADLELARVCWEHCRKNHPLCRPSCTPSLDLLVIDCSTETLVTMEAPFVYAALSYVWGSAGKDADNQRTKWQSGAPLGLIPKTIRDAIVVCLNIGIPYLWVDRYCIDYSDPSKQAHQINNMHQIYQGATLTIEAKSGTNAESGLAGLNGWRRAVPASIDVGNFRIIKWTSGTSPQPDNSTWATRGWTLQEDFFSKRKLCFTDGQFIYQCSQMMCLESEKYWIEGYFRDEYMWKSRLHLDRVGRPFADGEVYNESGRLGEFYSQVEKFSCRELSLESDSLRAFAGILQHYSELSNPVFHVWGIALLPLDTNTFLRSLCWSHIYSLNAHGLYFERRAAFPSWSWAGWGGEIRNHTKRITQPWHTDIDVLLEYEGRQPETLASLFNSATTNPIQLAYPTALHLNNVRVLLPASITVLPELRCQVGDHLTGIYYYSPARPAHFHPAYLPDGLKTSQLEVLVIGYHCSSSSGILATLVVENLPERKVERIGIILFQVMHMSQDSTIPDIIQSVTYAEPRNFKLG